MWPHVVSSVATATDGGHGEALFEESHAVNAVLVVLEDVGLGDIASLADRRIFAMTTATELGDIDGRYRRAEVRGRQNLMSTVAELAAGSIGVVLGGFLPVDAGGVLVLLFDMAAATVHPTKFIGMRDFLDVLVTVDTCQGRMGRGLQGSGIECRRDAGLSGAVSASVIVAASAIFVLRSLRFLCYKGR
jgi:hypothetical protein